MTASAVIMFYRLCEKMCTILDGWWRVPEKSWVIGDFSRFFCWERGGIEIVVVITKYHKRGGMKKSGYITGGSSLSNWTPQFSLGSPPSFVSLAKNLDPLFTLFIFYY